MATKQQRRTAKRKAQQEAAYERFRQTAPRVMQLKLRNVPFEHLPERTKRAIRENFRE